MIWILFLAFVLMLAVLWFNAQRGPDRLLTCAGCLRDYDPKDSTAWSPGRFCSAYCEGDDDPYDLIPEYGAD